MAESTKRTIRKGRVYHVTVATVAYRAFVWQAGSGFCGRVEEHPQIALCRGRTALAVRDQLCAALAVSVAPTTTTSRTP
jgi:hypothetical protein